MAKLSGAPRASAGTGCHTSSAATGGRTLLACPDVASRAAATREDTAPWARKLKACINEANAVAANPAKFAQRRASQAGLVGFSEKE